MPSKPAILLANDNAPAQARPNGDATGFNAMLRAQEVERDLHKQKTMQTQLAAQTGTRTQTLNSESPSQTKWGLMLALLCTLAATLLAAYSFYTGQSATLSIIALVAMVWSALWSAYLASDERKSTTAEWSIIIATIAGLGIWVLSTREWGLPMSAADGVAGLAVLSALSAAIMRSRMTLIISACAGLAWVALYTLLPTVNLFSIWAYPVLALISLVIAGQKNSRLSAFIILLGLHGWLFWLVQSHVMAGSISLLHTAGIATLVGLAHYRLGKAAGDAGWTTASLHVVTGWLLAMAGALALQHYWLGGEHEIWQNLQSTPLGTLSWQIIGALSIALVGLAGVIRMAYRQMSLLAVLFSLIVTLGAATLFDQRQAITEFISSELNTSATPLVGLIIGAAILASAVAMAFNGARRRSNLMLFAGLGVIAVELALMLTPNLWTVETFTVFSVALITSLCFAALFSTDTKPSLKPKRT